MPFPVLPNSGTSVAKAISAKRAFSAALEALLHPKPGFSARGGAAEAAVEICGFTARLEAADTRVARGEKKQVPPLRRRVHSGSGRNDKIVEGSLKSPSIGV